MAGAGHPCTNFDLIPHYSFHRTALVLYLAGQHGCRNVKNMNIEKGGIFSDLQILNLGATDAVIGDSSLYMATV